MIRFRVRPSCLAIDHEFNLSVLDEVNAPKIR